MLPRRKASTTPSNTYYTTFNVATMLGVSAPTVVNWIKAGLIKAHKTPGGHRRIVADELVAFAKKHNYPLPPELAEEPEAPSRRVLIVDDDPDFAEVLRDWLAARGEYEIEVADSGFTAGLTMGRFRPNVVVMDIMMPGMDGFESLRRLREDPQMRATPVVACTAFHDPQVEARARREGFAAYIEKTAAYDRIVDTIDGLLAGARP